MSERLTEAEWRVLECLEDGQWRSAAELARRRWPGESSRGRSGAIGRASLALEAFGLIEVAAYRTAYRITEAGRRALTSG